MTEKKIGTDNQPQEKFTDELLSDKELDNVAGGDAGSCGHDRLPTGRKEMDFGIRNYNKVPSSIDATSCGH